MLEELDVSGANVADAGVCAIVRQCPHLHTLDVFGTTIGDRVCAALGAASPNLRRLHIEKNTAITANSTAMVARCIGAGLKDLHTTHLEVDCFLERAPALERLCYVRIPQHTVDHIVTVIASAGRHCGERLRTFELRCREPPRASVFVPGDAVCSAARSWPGLHRLQLECVNLSDDNLDAIAASCPLLDELCVREAVHVTDTGVCAFVERCGANLRVLNVRGTRVTDASLRALAAFCTRLEDLDASENLNVTSRGVIPVAQRCQRLRLLRVSRTAVDDEGLAAFGIPYSTALETLDVAGCASITPVGVMLFMGLEGYAAGRPEVVVSSALLSPLRRLAAAQRGVELPPTPRDDSSSSEEYDDDDDDDDDDDFSSDYD
jgi:hypothetical protein